MSHGLVISSTINVFRLLQNIKIPNKSSSYKIFTTVIFVRLFKLNCCNKYGFSGVVICVSGVFKYKGFCGGWFRFISKWRRKSLPSIWIYNRGLFAEGFNIMHADSGLFVNWFNRYPPEVFDWITLGMLYWSFG